MAMVVGRRVLGAYVSALCGGSGLDRKDTAGADEVGDEDWRKAGEETFKSESGEELRKEVVEGVLGEGGMSGWCDEQVSFPIRPYVVSFKLNFQTTILRQLYAHLLEAEEDWLGAARALMQIPLEGGSR